MELYQVIIVFVAVLNIGACSRRKEKVASIVDGEAIDITRVPHQVSLEKLEVFICGGALISNYHVLTAGHCIAHVQLRNHVDPDELRIRAGTSKAGTFGTIMLVDLIRLPQNFSMKPLKNDIGIIKLKNPAVISDKLKPIALHTKMLKTGQKCSVTGYGSQEGSMFPSPENTLKIAELQVYGKEECQKKYGYKGEPDEICAGNRKGNDGHCFGDSGGPLTYNNKLAGVISALLVCGGKPAIYTSVHLFQGWINECVKRTNYGPYAC